MILVSSFLLALMVSVTVLPLLKRSAEPLGLVDAPNERKVHKVAIPRVGGIAIVIGSLIPVLIWDDLAIEIQAYLLGSICILIFGIWDDRKELNYKIKFFGQICAIAIFVIYGGVYIQWLPFQGISAVPLWFSIFLTFFALLGITNAVNLVDGLDGLAGGTSLLSLGAIGFLAYQFGSETLAMLCIAICGAIFGFLRFNTHPASVFMGDTGSQFLGFSIGVAAVLLTQKVNSALSPIMPLILLGLPILDTLTVMSRRMLNGRSPFSADKNHFHHRLIDLGFAHYEAVIVIYFVQICLIATAFFLMYRPDWLLALVFVVFCFGFNGIFKLAEGKGLLYNGTWLSDNISSVFSNSSVLDFRKKLLSFLRIYVFISIPIYLFACVWQAKGLSGMSYLLSAMLFLSIFLILTPLNKEQLWVSRLVWFSACGLGVFCSAQTGMIENIWVQLFNVSLLMVVLLSFLVEENDGMTINPLDVIILILITSLLVASTYDESLRMIATQVSQSIVFLYVIELMMHGKEKYRHYARFALAFVFLSTSAFSVV